MEGKSEALAMGTRPVAEVKQELLALVKGDEGTEQGRRDCAFALLRRNFPQSVLPSGEWQTPLKQKAA